MEQHWRVQIVDLAGRVCVVAEGPIYSLCLWINVCLLLQVVKSRLSIHQGEDLELTSKVASSCLW